MKIIGFTTCHNELTSGHLKRCLEHLSSFCDDIIFLDRSSTDLSIETAREFTNNIIITKNDMRYELEHKQQIIDMAKRMEFDWMVWLDCDETFDRQAEDGTIRALCASADQDGIDAYSCRLYNLWKSLEHYRTDEYWNSLVQARIWKNVPRLRYPEAFIRHPPQQPLGLENVQNCDVRVIHYGFASVKWQMSKYEYYKSVGQEGHDLERLNSEKGMKLEPFEKTWFPKSFLIPSRTN